MNKAAGYYVSIAIAASLVLLGLYEDDTVVTVYAAMALVLYSVLLYSGRDGLVDPRIPLFSAVIMLAASMVLLFALNFEGNPYSSFIVDADGNEEVVFSAEKRFYAHLEGAVAWCISYPLAFVAIVCISTISGSRLNRFLLGGFLVFGSEAFTSLMLVAVSLFNKDQLGETLFFVDELAYLFTGLVLSVIAAVAIVRLMRGKKFVIPRDGPEVSE